MSKKCSRDLLNCKLRLFGKKKLKKLTIIPLTRKAVFNENKLQKA